MVDAYNSYPLSHVWCVCVCSLFCLLCGWPLRMGRSGLVIFLFISLFLFFISSFSCIQHTQSIDHIIYSLFLFFEHLQMKGRRLLRTSVGVEDVVPSRRSDSSRSWWWPTERWSRITVTTWSITSSLLCLS